MKKRVVLTIDTSSKDTVKSVIEVEGARYEQMSQIQPTKAQMILSLIEELLKMQQLNLNDITQLQVNTGPGSFTGLRVGITVANTLGMLLCVPVNGYPAGKIIKPLYK